MRCGHKAIYRKARIACGATVRWKRSITEQTGSEVERQGDSQEQDHRPTYLSRLLNCVRCGHPNETSWMQLRSRKGFRAIHCRACGYQQLAGRNKCQCGTIWHHCPTHRVDPTEHLSKKAPKKTENEKEAGRRQKEQAEAERGGGQRTLKRKDAPPVVEERSEAIRNRRGKKARAIVTKNFRLKPMRSVAPVLRCNPAMLKRIRLKQKANKEMETEKRVRGSSSTPPSVELAAEYRSTPADHIMAASRTSGETRANEGCTTENHLKRREFEEQLHQDILMQASRSAKRMKYAEMNPLHVSTNSMSSSCKYGNVGGVGKPLRQTLRHFGGTRSEQGAIGRLLSNHQGG